ncbi:unnamed protein product [Paramecium pentaurelia]|uniref:EML-like second beta-propeller domain-containing protein n=1 Tax=Paramecium pentaurelia TaxID=43138 RepID=A0A8S1VDE0_9CILI|nr:unnamed protein product [Paramecium pentaurelia]
MQDFYQKQEALADIFDQVKDLDKQTFGVILEVFRKQKVQDCIGYLSDDGNKRHYKQYIFKDDNIKLFDMGWKLDVVTTNMMKIKNILKQIKVHDFNQQDYSTEENKESKLYLIKCINENRYILDFLQFLVHLTSIDNNLKQCGSNSLHLLVQMKADLRKKNFENIKIQNTSLVGANFFRSNFSGSQFSNVNVSGVNLNGSLLLNCKWINLRIHELNKLDGHNDSVNSVCFSPDLTTLASGSGNYNYGGIYSIDNSIRLWDVKTGKQKAKLDGHTSTVYSVCFSPDGNTLASGSRDKSICLWDVKTKKKISKLDVHTSRVESVCFCPDGNTIASCCYNSIRLWDVKTGKQKAKLDGHTSNVYSVCFCPDGYTLASCSYDNSIRLWDFKTGQQKAKLDGHTFFVMSVCFSPDGNTLASGGGDKSIRLWDVKTGQQKAQLDGHMDIVRSLCFSPDGNTLASGSSDLSIRLWDVKTKYQNAKLDGHTDAIMSVCFSPDGNTLASGSYDKSIRLWDMETNKKRAKQEGHTSYVWSVCYSPDGNTLASSSWDNSIRLWDVKTGQEIQSSDKNYEDVLIQFKIPLQQNSPLSEISNYITSLIISQQTIFQAQGALILKGEFSDESGIDLTALLKQKGSFFLEDFNQK